MSGKEAPKGRQNVQLVCVQHIKTLSPRRGFFCCRTTTGGLRPRLWSFAPPVLIYRTAIICILVQALIFGAIHMDPSQMVYGTLYGILLGWLCCRTGSLIPGIVLHVVNNSTALLLPDYVDETFNELSVFPQAAILIASLLVLSGGIYWFHRKCPAKVEHELNAAYLQT